MAGKNASLNVLASQRMLQVLIGLLFVMMGLIGFSTGRGVGGEFAGELARILGGGERELIRNIVSVILLVCGLLLLASLWVKTFPAKFVTWAKIGILFIWIALIVVLDLLTVNFGRLDGSEWFVWIEQVVIHLIVLGSIVTIRRS